MYTLNCVLMSPNRCNAQCTAQSVTITYDPIRAIFIRSCNGGRRSPTVAFREQLLHFVTFSFCHIESPRHITLCCTILSCVASENLFCIKYILKKCLNLGPSAILDGVKKGQSRAFCIMYTVLYHTI